MSCVKEEHEEVSVMEVSGLKTEEQEVKKEEYEEITVTEVHGLKTEDQDVDSGAPAHVPVQGPAQPEVEQLARHCEEDNNDGATSAKMPDYVQKCAVPGCEGDVGTFHTLPKETKCQRAWLMFIYNRIPDNFNSKLLVCSEHFTPDNFSNLGQYRAGFAQRLTLKRGAVPTLLASQPQPEPVSSSRAVWLYHRWFVGSRSSSELQSQLIAPGCFVLTSDGKRSTPYQLPLTNDVGCQTEAPSLASQGTQLSWKTLRPHLRSKGVQATVPCQSVAVGTTSQRPSSKPQTSPRLAKRPRLELEEEEDLTYEPSQSTAPASESPRPPGPSRSSYGEAKFLVFEQCLLSLFQTCPVCTKVCNVRPHRRGTFVAVDQLCPHCAFYRQWRSQPVIGSTPVGDLQLSAAIYFSGASFLKMQKVFRAMQLKTHSYDAFRRHARTYIEPAIVHKWNTEQKEVLQRLSQEDGVVVGGDMRAAAGGHSTKYGSYSMMHLQSNTVIDVQLVQVCESTCQVSVEVDRVLASSEWQRVIFSDESRFSLGGDAQRIRVWRHRGQVSRITRPEDLVSLHLHPYRTICRNCVRMFKLHGMDYHRTPSGTSTAPYRDVWRVGLANTAARRHTERQTSSSEAGGSHHMEREGLSRSLDLLEESGVKLDCVVTDRHPETQKLLEDRKVGHTEGGSTARDELLTNQRVRSDVERLSPPYQTSTRERLHSAISRFVPKTGVLPFIAMLCRLYLASMHFNENAARPQTTTSGGEHMPKPLSPKPRKRGHGVSPAGKTHPTFGYVFHLMALVFDLVALDPLPHVEAVQRISVPQAAHQSGPPLKQGLASGSRRGDGGAYTSSEETRAPPAAPPLGAVPGEGRREGEGGRT
ncbi:hypothetical protein NFI96_030649 [Prochilodus magdalenae]|nr:hypothetical protein NFI96_030649 [Prochilodus magdalenae]